MPTRLRSLLIVVLALSLCCGVAAWDYTSRTPEYAATAQIRVPREAAADLQADPEATQISVPSDVLVEAVARLKARNVQLPLASPLDSETDVLSRSTVVDIDRQAGFDDLTLTYTTVQADDAVPVLTTIADAYLAFLHKNAPAAPATVSPPLESERTQLDRALAQQQSVVAECQQKLREQTLDDAKRALVLDKIKSLSQSLTEARRSRLEAEHRLQQAKKDLEAGVPVELLAARWPDGPAKSLAQEALTQIRLHRELKQQAATFVERSAVYGKNHPQMLDLQKKIDDLTARLTAAEKQRPASAPLGMHEVDVHALLLRSLESEHAEQQAAERDLQEQWQTEQTSLEKFAASQKGVEDAQRELARIQADRDRVSQQIAEAQKQQQSRTATLSESPVLTAEPVWPRIEYYLGGGPAAGLLLGMVLARLFRVRRRYEDARDATADVIPLEGDTPAKIQERRLARAVRLKTMRLRAA